MKRFVWLAAFGAWVVVACSPQSAPTPTATAPEATAAPTATAQPVPSAEAGPTNPTAAPPQQQPTREQVVQIQPGDWVRGPDTAAVTFIEWGDFQ